MSSGQPSVENGHRPELNHVSKMSGSWVQLGGRPAAGLAGGRAGRRRPSPSRGRPGSTRPGSDGPTTAGGRRSSRGCWSASAPRSSRTARAGSASGRSRVASSARVGQGPGPDEPLGLEARLDDVVAALAAPDDHLVRRRARPGRRAPRGRPRSPRGPRSGRGRRKRVPVLVDRGVVGEDRGRRQPVSPARWRSRHGRGPA